MCLAVPLKITQINEHEAIGAMHNVKSKIRVDLLPDVKIGDYVMVHAGFAIEIMDEDEALSIIEAYNEVEKSAL